MKRSSSPEKETQDAKKTKSNGDNKDQKPINIADSGGGGNVSTPQPDSEGVTRPSSTTSSTAGEPSTRSETGTPTTRTPTITPVPIDVDEEPATSDKPGSSEKAAQEEVKVKDEDKTEGVTRPSSTPSPMVVEPSTRSETGTPTTRTPTITPVPIDVDEEPATSDKPEEKKWERWQLVPTTARQRMNYLLTTSKLSDCTFIVGPPDNRMEFKLHSVILAMTSPEFEDLLTQSREILVEDVDPSIFRQILEYVYLDYVNLWSVEKTQALYRASVRFKLPNLCEKAVEYMMARMNLESIWPIFEAAIATQDQILTDECTKFFKKNINELLRHAKFPTVDQSVIAKLVSDDSLGVPEADLISGVLRWAHQKCLDTDQVPNLENKRSLLLSGTIYQLRFMALSKEFFTREVAYNKTRGDESILTLEESYAILMNMVQPNSYPMPEGFSTIVKQRTAVDRTRLIRRLFNPLGTYQNQSSPRIDKLTVLPGPSMTAPFGCKSFLLDLVVSKNITLYGIQVPTFFPAGLIGSAPKMYEETYIVSIQNASKPNKPMIGSINWTGKVTYNSFVDLMFKDIVNLEQNNTYTIMVYTNNTYYLNQKLCTVEESNNVKFTLKDSVSLFGKPGKQDFAFVSQLIYSA